MSKAWDDQYNSGVEEGMQKMAIDLYKEAAIDIAKATEKCNMSEEEFLKLVDNSKMK